MLLGSMLAGQAFANSPVAAVHALAYPIGGHFDVPHGLSNALVLPHVLRFNASACEGSYAELAPTPFPELRRRQPARRRPSSRRSRRCGEGSGCSSGCAMSAFRQDAGDVADDAMKQTRLLVNNPRPLTRSDARAIYEAAW